MTEPTPEPVYVPPPKKWRLFDSYKWQKFKYYSHFPRGRFITYIIGGTVFYFTAYTVGVYLWKGPDHPINNYTFVFFTLHNQLFTCIFRWKQMKDKGLLSPELAEKEKVLIQYDIDRFTEQTSAFIPHPREGSKPAMNRII